jgi:hypothetical protein
MNKLNLNHNEYIKRVNFRITNLIRNSFDIDTAHSLEKHLKLAYEQYQKSYLKNESTSYSSLNPDEPPEMNNLNYEIQKVETFIEKI